MKLISHRGNTNGVKARMENHPYYIIDAIEKGYDVEVDIWNINGDIILGHDEPTYETSMNFLLEHNDKLWLHCKNLESLYSFKDSFNCFFHDSDDAVLTSKNFIWTFPGKKLMQNSIAVKPEGYYSKEELKVCYGICSDFVVNYKSPELL